MRFEGKRNCDPSDQFMQPIKKALKPPTQPTRDIGAMLAARSMSDSESKRVAQLRDLIERVITSNDIAS